MNSFFFMISIEGWQGLGGAIDVVEGGLTNVLFKFQEFPRNTFCAEIKISHQ